MAQAPTAWPLAGVGMPKVRTPCIPPSPSPTDRLANARSQHWISQSRGKREAAGGDIESASDTIPRKTWMERLQS